MKRYVCILITTLLITNCVAQYTPPVPEKGFTYIEPVNTEYVTYEKSFGSAKSGTKPEFQLIKPTSIAVNDTGDVLVFDDGRIKVFSQNGSEKRIVGSPGEGPGKFSRYDEFFLSPNGYLTVLSKSYGSITSVYYFSTVFDPDYVYINKSRFTDTPLFLKFLKSQNITRLQYLSPNLKTPIDKIYYLNNTDRVLNVFSKLDEEYITKNHIYIYNENTQKNNIIVKTELSIGIFTWRNERTVPGLGKFCWEILPDRKIVYINTEEDKHQKSDLKVESSYTIHIRSIDTDSDVKIIHPFTATAFPDSMGAQYFDNTGRKSRPERFKEVLEFFKNRKFYASVSDVLVDGDYAFFYLFKKEDLTDKSDKEELKAKNTPYTVDVLDTKTGKFLSSVQLPVKFKAIKNGYAYDVELNMMGCNEIRKYCLNPAVYGK